ncbi:ribonuclease E/G [Rhodospira trueperi]|uniref:Ribonuclease E/ribonuclease G n=1 Tax=Rhodospira trueperi TaxID=69960 RepID=A0A1G7C0V3_9PROT|nr:ribonuclease E/G [Rhodospira trueperi]SDE32951.1 ribonuclease E/ribonuclease G [Rhodospira trueperi]
MTATTALVVSVGPGETRAARLDHGRLTAITHHRVWAADPGAVLLGRMGPRAGGGAMVDLGLWGEGFLDGREVKGDAPTEGAPLLLQVRQTTRTEPHGGAKAARLTRAVALTSPRLALGGRRPGVAVSSRITDAAERSRLLGLLKSMAAKGDSLVARTAAAGATADVLAADLERLRTHWTEMTARADAATAPALVWPAPVDWGGLLGPADPVPETVILDDAVARPALDRDLAQWLDPPPPVRMHPDPDDLFEATGVADALDAALSPVVPLPSGGRLVIEPTAALIAVDVDAGSGSARAANPEALAALPRELRLRGLSGSILVDLIPDGPRLPGPARRALEDALAADPASTRLAGVSRLGLLEITRERRAPALAERLTGPAAQALAALRMVRREARAAPTNALAVTVAPSAAALMRGPLAESVATLTHRHGLCLTVRDDVTLAVDAPPRVAPP